MEEKNIYFHTSTMMHSYIWGDNQYYSIIFADLAKIHNSFVAGRLKPSFYYLRSALAQLVPDQETLSDKGRLTFSWVVFATFFKKSFCLAVAYLISYITIYDDRRMMAAMLLSHSKRKIVSPLGLENLIFIFCNNLGRLLPCVAYIEYCHHHCAAIIYLNLKCFHLGKFHFPLEWKP